jgi:GTP:adenosylcobinamide-phosphate guanylyltransferase
MNETINTEATFYYQANETRGIFVSHNIMNYLHTTDENYVADTKQILDKQLANSNLISGVNEKDRNSYFFDLEKMIRSFKLKIEADLAFE